MDPPLANNPADEEEEEDDDEDPTVRPLILGDTPPPPLPLPPTSSELVVEDISRSQAKEAKKCASTIRCIAAMCVIEASIEVVCTTWKPAKT